MFTEVHFKGGPHDGTVLTDRLEGFAMDDEMAYSIDPPSTEKLWHLYKPFAVREGKILVLLYVGLQEVKDK